MATVIHLQSMLTSMSSSQFAKKLQAVEELVESEVRALHDPMTSTEAGSHPQAQSDASQQSHPVVPREVAIPILADIARMNESELVEEIDRLVAIVRDSVFVSRLS